MLFLLVAIGWLIQLCILQYMSQVTYGILRICRVGFLRTSDQRSADVLEPSAESSLVIRRIIAEYLRNLRRAPAECSAEGLRRTFEGD